MVAPLDELYLQWLYRHNTRSFRDEKDNRARYGELFKRLYEKEFVWIVPNDDNRVEDGKLLREEFMADVPSREIDPDWMELGCSFLEMLVGLSRRLAFEGEGEPRRWFWELIDNLELLDCVDPEAIDEKLDTVIWRTYERDGRGGLFPLKRARKDQRKVEIWYQLNAYLLELG
jgi:hypothetical protein